MFCNVRMFCYIKLNMCLHICHQISEGCVIWELVCLPQIMRICIVWLFLPDIQYVTDLYYITFLEFLFNTCDGNIMKVLPFY
jgi:hypothetical protein